MPIPLLIWGAVAGVTALYGAKKGYDGYSDIEEAKKISEEIKEKYDETVDDLESARKRINIKANEYGEKLVKIRATTFKRIVEILEKIEKKTEIKSIEVMSSIDVGLSKMKEYKAASIEAQDIISGGATATIAGLAAGKGAVGLATLIGSASTGTAIGSLSGAAATNATLAWLGGGSLAAGGGGMAAGTAVLGGLLIGPALAVGGLVFAKSAEKQLTEAKKYQSEVRVKISQIKSMIEVLERMQMRIGELDGIATRLNSLANSAIDKLDLQSFDIKKKPWYVRVIKKNSDSGLFKIYQKIVFSVVKFIKNGDTFLNEYKDIPDEELKKLSSALVLVKGLSEQMKIPIIDNFGNIDDTSTKFVAKYKSI